METVINTVENNHIKHKQVKAMYRKHADDDDNDDAIKSIEQEQYYKLNMEKKMF